MSSNNDSVKKTFIVATVLCIVCSILVSGAAVALKDIQEKNKKFDIKKNLLLSAGLVTKETATNENILTIFKNIETLIVDLKTGERVEGIDPESFDPAEAAKSPKLGMEIPSELDKANIKRRAKYGKVFLYKENNQIKISLC